MQTLTGRRMNPLDASPEDIDPDDIAGALANICRFGGHSRAFYSVAQHSVIVCDLLAERGGSPDELMAALKANKQVAERLPKLEQAVHDGQTTPGAAVAELMGLFASARSSA